MSSRTDTSAHSEAAEVMTVAELLDRGVMAGQYPRNFPRVDVFAFLPDRAKVINIQVKYRHQAKDTATQLDDLAQVDFVVLVRGNHGQSVGGRSTKQVWVVPASDVAEGKVKFASLDDKFLHAWELIVEACRG